MCLISSDREQKRNAGSGGVATYVVRADGVLGEGGLQVEHAVLHVGVRAVVPAGCTEVRMAGDC